MFVGLCAAAFLPAFAVGVYAKTPLTKAALYRMITAAVIWFLWTAFFDAAEAKPLGTCQAIFG
jgi:SSS family solute:Na+ symporter